MKKLFLSFCLPLFLYSLPTFAQSTYAPLQESYYQLLHRYELLNGQWSSELGSMVKPFQREAIATFLDSLELGSPSQADQFNLDYLRLDNWEYTDTLAENSRKAIFGVFYKNQRDLLSVREKDFELYVNPVLHLGVGADQAEGNPYINTRAVQLHGTIDRKIGFYTYIGENQIAFPDYVDRHIRNKLNVPQEGFWKGYGERGVDFLTARGHISFSASKHIDLQLGHGRHSVGNGYRSMLLSDFANNYLFLRINTKVWKLQYTNIFAQMTADLTGNSTGLYGTAAFPHKYFAMHRLGASITPKLQLGLFESITYGDASGNFDFNYLNPIIFYRAVEQQGGSAGNALLGLDLRWLPLRGVALYTQALIDEFVISEIRSGKNWWGNKYALQFGLEYANALSIDNLDLQLEYNRVRPYTYAHEDLYRSYTHYEQPLAHPLGANFKELIGIARFQPIGRLQLQAKLIGAQYGGDTLNSNWGHNILLDNRTKERDYNNTLGQGVENNLLIADFIASYQLWHNMFIDLRYLHRSRQNDLLPEAETTNFTSIALRWNIRQRYYDF
ncbi:hypothetical protein OKW21_000458 [Catalinimonas alkaloidigena]|uniref:capsule assembly Wzi family protein n=1 Tax=Catalinimonas alkaloidigena TaxID=1075417 RepID=UPI002405050C|nr:capsule assembly Wzi family protein [Catalinimonas alkaloidigena]MDF9795195.1 hypothetical protein [Catalinimonas alkaloidigena]